MWMDHQRKEHHHIILIGIICAKAIVEPRAESPPPAQPGRLKLVVLRRRVCFSAGETARGRVATAASAFRFNEPLLNVEWIRK